jgi:hypothetical protein
MGNRKTGRRQKAEGKRIMTGTKAQRHRGIKGKRE